MIVEVDYSFSPEDGKMVCGVWVWGVLDDDDVVVGIVDRLADAAVCQWARWCMWKQQQQ